MQVNYHGIPDCYFDERDYYDDTKPPIIYAPFNASPDVLRNNRFFEKNRVKLFI